MPGWVTFEVLATDQTTTTVLAPGLSGVRGLINGHSAGGCCGGDRPVTVKVRPGPRRPSHRWLVSEVGGWLPGCNPSAVDPRCEPEMSGPPRPSPSPHQRPQRRSVVAPESPGWRAAQRRVEGEQLRRKAAVESVRCRWAGGGEPKQLLADLDLRVHAPVPEVVIVRASGSVNTHTAPFHSCAVPRFAFGRAGHRESNYSLSSQF